MSTSLAETQLLSNADIKEELSYAFVHSIASRAGYTFDFVRKDRDSIDVKVCSRRAKTFSPYFTSAELELQVKATAVDLADEAFFPFDLPIKNYNDLRLPTMCPRLLVIFVMPINEALWLHSNEKRLILRHCAYWHNLKGESETKNSTTKRVVIQRKNLFTVESLMEIMDKISKREEIGYEL